MRVTNRVLPSRLFFSRVRAARVLWLLLLSSLASLSATGQQPRTPFSGSLMRSPGPARAEEQDAEDEFIKPSRPGVAAPAEIQKPGVLQLEFGYDANFRAEEFRTQQSAPLTLRFAAARRLLLQADLDTFKSETDRDGERQTGVGDARLGLQVVALGDAPGRPALAFAYYVKLPAASEEKGLGTGRFDHRFAALLSKKFGQTDVDFNAALLVVGREQAPGWVRGGQAALAISREFENDFGVEAELSGQTKDDVQPRGLYALGALTYKANRRLRFDAGARFGLNPDAPRVGLFAGFAVGVADFYKRGK